jgi:hypothetical protein
MNLIQKGNCNVQLKFVLMTVLTLAVILAGCGPANSAREWSYSTDARHVLIEADTRGGFVPVEVAVSHIPDLRLYGDGRVIWSEKSDDGATTVWEGRLSDQEIRALLDWMDEQGYFEMEEFYTVDNAPTDLPSSCIAVALQDQSHRVCEYFDGAPAAFDEIYQRLHEGAGATGAQNFEPEIAWVSAHGVPGIAPEEAIAWPEGLSPAPSAFGEGMWVEGEALDFLWSNRLEPGPMFFQESGSVYVIVLQIPGVTPDAPPAP